ncbi:MAG TPA: Flp family type IVb pilin [Caulobacteraceae bacterium]|jgi:pilus assembly protein Flp/PilA
MTSSIKRLVRDLRGATAIEYGLIAALIAVSLIGALSVFGGGMRDGFVSVDGRMAAAHKPPA